jgi:hypothetical protein
MSVKQWMNWEAGVDLVGLTSPNLSMPNVIIHVARVVHTPVGSAPAGMVLWQPDPSGPPAFAGFISTDVKVGAYFGPNIFAGTPFEKAPVAQARIDISTDLPGSVSSRVEVAGLVFETRLGELGNLDNIHRHVGPMTPFVQMNLEAAAKNVSLKVNGKPVPLTIPPIGISGGPAAVWAPAGIYSR